MIIVRNERLIKRSTTFGRISSIVSILILAGGMFISFQYPDQFTYSLLALVFGFTLSQVGIAYGNRFGRSPRPDQQLDAALKGLDDQYALYHYQSPVTHLLVGPAGIWILIPMTQLGRITYNEARSRWKRTGGSFYMKLFGQDVMGNPLQEITSSTKRLQKALTKVPELQLPPIRSALVFTNESAEVEAENAPYPTVHARQLKKLIRKEAKGTDPLPISSVKTIQDLLGLESKT